ncbi:MAG: hypothetical protein K0S32_1973 [Bacteroidetes bacterium]|jgi:hypothetical protein|nr:hypothetical protein [Bacteroidota bacterium]
MKAVYIMIIISVAITSCNKKRIEIKNETLVSGEMKQGLPENFREINGYFYSSYVLYLANGYFYINQYSTLSDPAKNIMPGYSHFFDQVSYINPKYYGNVDVGVVTADNIILSKNTFSPSLVYSGGKQTYQSCKGRHCLWSIEGNRSFKPIEVQSLRTYPELVIGTIPANIQKSEGVTFNLEGIASDYDSLVVGISEPNSASNIVTKSFGPGAKSVTFKPSDFENFNSTTTVYGSLFFNTHNYCHQLIDNRMYVFEQSNKCVRSIMINP